MSLVINHDGRHPDVEKKMEEMTVRNLLNRAAEIQLLKDEVVAVTNILKLAFKSEPFLTDNRFTETRWYDEDDDCRYTWQIDFGTAFHDEPRVLRCIRLLRTQTNDEGTQTIYSSKESVPSSYSVQKVHAELQRLVDLCVSVVGPVEFKKRMAPFIR